MKHLIQAVRVTLIFIIGTGLIFPLLIWGLAQGLFPHQANGSLAKDGAGAVIGSTLIGQTFTSPRYFHPRPSAAGAGYDGINSSGTNLGPTNSKLITGIADDPATEGTDETYLGIDDLAAAYRQINGLDERELLPVDAVTRSASGLDPHISPQNALLQSTRVATARGVPLTELQRLLRVSIEPSFLGLYGEPRINVFTFNRLMDEKYPK